MAERDDRGPWDEGRDVLAPLTASGETLARQDAVIGAAADATGAALRPVHAGRRRPAWPASLAAGLAAGLLVAPWLPSGAPAPDAPVALSLPADPTRGAAAGASTPVTAVSAEVWYRYIQELIYRGDVVLAERHLRAFVRVHPDYRHER